MKIKLFIRAEDVLKFKNDEQIIASAIQEDEYCIEIEVDADEVDIEEA